MGTSSRAPLRSAPLRSAPRSAPLRSAPLRSAPLRAPFRSAPRPVPLCSAPVHSAPLRSARRRAREHNGRFVCSICTESAWENQNRECASRNSVNSPVTSTHTCTVLNSIEFCDVFKCIDRFHNFCGIQRDLYAHAIDNHSLLFHEHERSCCNPA